MATVMSYDMEEFLDSWVTKYCELAKITSPLRSYTTPILPDDHSRSAAGAPGSGPVTECPWCHHTATPTSFVTYSSITALMNKPKVRPVETGDEPQQGELHEVASRVLMKVLWAARLCRRDLLRAVNRLATCVAKWTSEADLMLYRLMGYIASTKHLRMFCWVGDELAMIIPHLFADSDLGGCSESQRSTSGCHHALCGPCIRFPIVGISKRQGCVSHSTPEAEMVALDFSIRTVGLPYLTLWHTLMPHHPPLVVHEDNQAMIRVMQTGRNPTMRYLGRTHRISVAWLHEVFKDPNHLLVYEESNTMCVDI